MGNSTPVIPFVNEAGELLSGMTSVD